MEFVEPEVFHGDMHRLGSPGGVAVFEFEADAVGAADDEQIEFGTAVG